MKYVRAVLFCLYTLILYLGLPLLGWGLDDLRGFFAFYPRLEYAAVVVGFGLVVGYQAIDSPEGIRGGQGQTGKLVLRQHVVRIAMTLLLFAALVFMPFADRRGLGVMPASLALRWLGLAFSALGYALIFWSGVALGRMYSAEVTVQVDHQLVTTGPYRMIRHPRYLGVMLVAIGLSLLFRAWIGLGLSVLVLVVLLDRIRDEEALMRQEFGEAWDAYCVRSWRLVPYVY
jgi:protein-S-isoprenylcysteine O-methyltransferase Ste14